MTDLRPIILAVLIAVSWPAHAQGIRIIDADTIDAGYSENVRLTRNGGAAFDAPETWRPECAYEAALGEVATNRLRELLSQGEVSLTILPAPCGYGRLCGALSVNGVNVGDILIAEGLAMPSRNFSWCER